jgi:poly-beta-1,6-N-acetyl-D-glucosamine synthase
MQNKRYSAQCLLWLAFFYATSILIMYLAFTRDYIPSDKLAFVRIAIFVLLAPIFIKYVIQLLAIPFYFLRERKNRSIPLQAQQPKVSVLVPAWNEEVGILKTIRSILASRYDNLELIVINDGSTDATHKLVTSFIREQGTRETNCTNINNYNKKIRYLKLTNGGKAKALNKAIDKATGEIIVTIDADSVIDKNAIANMVRQFTNVKVAAVAGNVIVGNKKKPIEFMQQLEYVYGFFFKCADSVFNSVYIIGGAAAAYRKEVLMALGGFDEKIITEDIEMSTRILAHGYQTRYAANAVIYTEGPSDWKGLCNQRLRWKFGRLTTFIKHRTLFFSRQQGNPYLTFLLLPVAIYAELTLLLEGVLLAIFYSYMIYTQDYVPLALVILFMSLMVCLQVGVDSKRRFHLNLLALAPIAWLVFYVIDIIELQALCRSLKRLIKQDEPKWQKWVRVGLFNPALLSPTLLSPTSLANNIVLESEHIYHENVA